MTSKARRAKVNVLTTKTDADGDISVRIQELEENFTTQLESFKGEISNLMKEENTVENTASIEQLMVRFEKFESAIINSIEQFKNQANKINLKLDMEVQKSYKNRLLLYGVKETEKEDLLTRVIDTLNDSLKLNSEPDTKLQKGDISDCYRYGAKTNVNIRPICIEFVYAWKRRNIFLMKKALKGSKYAVAELLTPSRYELYKEIRGKCQKECWTKDGKIAFIWKSKKYFVTTIEEYQKIIRNN